MRCLILFALAAVFCRQASAQMQELKVDNMSSNDGLPTDNVLYTYQDSYGFLWLASYEGLIRWDGTNYKRYFHSQGDTTSLSGNIVYKIVEDHQRRLWVGTIDGLNLFDRAHERFVRCDISARRRRKFLSMTYMKTPGTGYGSVLLTGSACMTMTAVAQSGL